MKGNNLKKNRILFTQFVLFKKSIFECYCFSLFGHMVDTTLLWNTKQKLISFCG